MHTKTVLLAIALCVALASAQTCTVDRFSSSASLDNVEHTCQSDTDGVTTYTYTLNHFFQNSVVRSLHLFNAEDTARELFGRRVGRTELAAELLSC